MVKRLRRRPLTAESGVRFPMGVPIFNAKLKGIELSVKKKLPFGKFFSAGVKASNASGEHLRSGAIPHGGTNI